MFWELLMFISGAFVGHRYAWEIDAFVSAGKETIRGWFRG